MSQNATKIDVTGALLFGALNKIAVKVSFIRLAAI